MREIKFRGYDFTKKIMIPFEKIRPLDYVYDSDLDSMFYAMENHLHIMQYTGLKDKNDTEIYKDDLLQDDKSRLFQVVEDSRISHTGYLMCCIKNKSENDHIQIDRFYEFYSWLYPDNFLEVIGNIYENSELKKRI